MELPTNFGVTYPCLLALVLIFLCDLSKELRYKQQRIISENLDSTSKLYSEFLVKIYVFAFFNINFVVLAFVCSENTFVITTKAYKPGFDFEEMQRTLIVTKYDGSISGRR